MLEFLVGDHDNSIRIVRVGIIFFFVVAFFSKNGTKGIKFTMMPSLYWVCICFKSVCLIIHTTKDIDMSTFKCRCLYVCMYHDSYVLYIVHFLYTLFKITFFTYLYPEQMQPIAMYISVVIVCHVSWGINNS